MRIASTWMLLIVLLAGGCARKSARPSGGSPKEAVQKYFNALVAQDWDKAYALLDAESSTRCSEEQFVMLAQNHRKNLGFEPTGSLIRSCDEQGDIAKAHVVLTSGANARGRRFREAVTLRRGDAGWRVVLADEFGMAAVQ